MRRLTYPITAILVLVFLISVPTQSFATKMTLSDDEYSDSDSEKKRGHGRSENETSMEVLEAIFTLGGLFGSGGSRGSSSSSSDSDECKPNYRSLGFDDCFPPIQKTSM